MPPAAAIFFRIKFFSYNEDYKLKEDIMEFISMVIGYSIVALFYGVIIGGIVYLFVKHLK